MYTLCKVIHKGSVFSHVTKATSVQDILDALRTDAIRDYPLTPIGLDLAKNGYAPGDELTLCHQDPLDLKALIVKQESSSETSSRLGYSIYDDTIIELEDQPQTTYSKNPMIDGKVHVNIRPWGSEESYDELERFFFNLKDPTVWFLNEGCIVDRTSHFFYTACCATRTCVADAIVYDKRYKNVIIGTNSCISKTMTPLMFADEATPWIWTMMERLCLKIVQGCRNDNNPKFTEARADVHRMALMTLRTLTADLGCGPMNTVSRDHPDFRKLQRKKERAIATYLEVQDLIAHRIKASSMGGVEAIGRTYEKLYKLYPKNDERSPDFKKHKIKVNALEKKNGSSMLDLFKATKEVITITPELRAHVTKKVREDEAAAEAEEAAAKAAAENDVSTPDETPEADPDENPAEAEADDVTEQILPAPQVAVA